MFIVVAIYIEPRPFHMLSKHPTVISLDPNLF